MPRYHATIAGPVAFSPEEEAEWDAMEAAHETTKETEATGIAAKANARATRIRAATEKLSSTDNAERIDALLELLAHMPGWPPQP